MADALSLLGIAFVSALVPLVNLEAYLGIRASVAAVHDLWLLSLVAGVGQMAGKLLWYYAGASALRWGRIRDFAEKPENRARLERWRGRTHDRPVMASLLVLVSASTGFPPFAVVAVLAGQLRMSVPVFVVAGLLGRWLRFAVVLGAAAQLAELFR